MKITINNKNLVRAVVAVERIVSRNHSLPILNNILLKTDQGRLRLTTTNLEIGINYLVSAKIDETGEIAIPARIFSDFINNLKEDKITLVTKNNTLNINTEKYKSQILGFNPKDFPIIPKINSDNTLTLPAKILKNNLTTVLDSVSVSETRPELAGVFLQSTDNQIIMASTDSFRLTEKITDLKNKQPYSFILPRNTAVELIRLLGDINEDVKIKYSENQVSFSTDDIEIVSRLIEGNYPDYKKVIPEKYISRLLVNKDSLDKNIRLAGLFSSNISDIKIGCDEGKLIINAKNSEKGEFQVVTEATLKNEPFDIALNYNYLLDGIKIIPTDNLIIEYTGQGSPLVIRPEKDNKDLTYLIMPLRN